MNEEELRQMIAEEPQDILGAILDDNTITNEANDTHTYEQTNTKQPIWKSPVLYVSILAIIGLILVNKYNIVESDMWSAITDLILVLLAGFGIINNPSNGSGLT